MLRPYQRAAVESVYAHLRTRDDNPVVVLPPAAGKSWIIAQIVADAVKCWGGRVLVLAHVQELLEQNADKIQQLCPEVPIGIYSSGLGYRDTKQPAIIAGIQSAYRRACDFDAFDLIVVDEAHLIPPDGEGMYRSFLADAQVVNPHLRVVGLTATPFRLSSGPICTPDGILNHICYEANVRELIRDGYLCPLVSKAGVYKADFGKLHIRAGEFVASEAEALMDDERLVTAACREIVMYSESRHSVLVFASGVQHGRHVARVLAEMSGLEVGFLDGQTPAAERAELIARFRRHNGKPLKYLVNVNVLTTGFDAPNIDCIAILRPTMSAGFYAQMVGRGFRLSPDKANCLVLDFGGNVLRHGPIDALQAPTRPRQKTGEALAKECPKCHALIATGYAYCPQCDHEFPPRERQQHDAHATTLSILSDEVIDMEYDVQEIRYNVHVTHDDAPRTMRVDYRVGQFIWYSEWICFEHAGYPRHKAEEWWRKRSYYLVPDTAEEAVALSDSLARATQITVRHGGRYPCIVDYVLEKIPDTIPF